MDSYSGSLKALCTRARCREGRGIGRSATLGAVAVEEAIQEAIRQREDTIRAELTDMLDPAACFAIDGEALRGENGLSKTEEAVLDLVAARFSVRRILDVIPQPDAEVVEALKSLLDGEVIRPA